MEKKEGVGKRIGKVLTNRIGTVVLFLTAILALVSIGGYWFEWEWAGLRGSPIEWEWGGVRGTAYGGPKTLWHWLDLLIIPIVLAAGALWFKRVETDIARTTENDRAQEAALETYLDRMSQLLLDKDDPLLKSKSDSACRDMAFTRTVTVLRRLDENRRNQVELFLRDARLLGIKRKKTEPSEPGAESAMGEESYRDALFAGRNLWIKESDPVALFAGRNLWGIDLSGADLQEVDLSGADLAYANLSRAYLGVANLAYANLSRANFSKAVLFLADLSGADLRGVDLSGADLRGVNGLTCGQLRLAHKWEHTYRDEALACDAPIPEPPKQEGGERE